MEDVINNPENQQKIYELSSFKILFERYFILTKPFLNPSKSKCVKLSQSTLDSKFFSNPIEFRTFGAYSHSKLSFLLILSQ